MTDAVVFACDANYAPYAYFAGRQIAMAHPDRSFDICVFSMDALTPPPAIAQLGIECRRIPGANPFEDAVHQTRHTAATYLQLLVPPLVHGNYRRILCLDCDVYFCGGDLRKLFDLDLRGNLLGGVRDHLQWRRPGKRVDEFKALGKAAAPYFNTGVMLIDVDKYMSTSMLERCLQLHRNAPQALTRHDQSMLNILLHSAWTEISPLWNWQYTWSSRFFADLAGPHIIHFIGGTKPWNDTGAKLPARFRRDYLDFGARYYPGEGRLVTSSPQAGCRPAGLEKMFLRHALVTAAMGRYLDRFADAGASYAVGDDAASPA